MLCDCDTSRAVSGVQSEPFLDDASGMPCAEPCAEPSRELKIRHHMRMSNLCFKTPSEEVVMCLGI